MNKYLMISAAALLSSATGTAAATAKWKYDVVCVGDTPSIGLTHSRVVYNAKWLDGIETGFGLAAKTKGIGNNVDLSNNYFGDARSVALNFDLSLPLKDGKAWTMWVELSGISSFEANAGTYTVNCTDSKRSGRNVIAETRALIERLKRARQ